MKATFVTREFGKTGAELTKAEFIQMMMEDILTAKEAYRAWSDKTAEEKYIADSVIYAERRKQAIDRIIENSYEKYKREYYRLRWVEKMSSCYPEVMERNSYSHFGRDLSSIKWDIKPWHNGSQYIDIKRNADRLVREAEYIYEEAIKNEYFKQATGWSIVEDFSTEFKLHLSDELQAKWKEDEHQLAANIARFYEGCTYWGD